LFFYLENRCFGTKIFYHIPANLFADYKTLDAEGNKTINIGKSKTRGMEASATGHDDTCTEWEIWYNPDGDPCFCTGDEYDTGERLWTGNCTSEPFPATQTVYIGGNGGCTWCTATGNGGTGGNGGGGTGCLGAFYIINPCNPPPPPPPQPTPCDLATN